MVDIKEKLLFGTNDVKEKKVEVYTQPKKAFEGFDVSFTTGLDTQKLKHEGMAMLRVLGAKHAKGALTNKSDLKNLEATLSAEVDIKKGILPQELAVMNAFYKIYRNK